MKTFYSKKDTSLGLIMWVPITGFLILALLEGNWVASGVLALVVAFCAYTWFGTYYTLTNEKLLVCSGPFRFGPIPIREIRQVSDSTGLLASPALSRHRLRICYGQYNEVVISPRNKESFVRELQEINPKIVHHTRLVKN